MCNAFVRTYCDAQTDLSDEGSGVQCWRAAFQIGRIETGSDKNAGGCRDGSAAHGHGHGRRFRVELGAAISYWRDGPWIGRAPGGDCRKNGPAGCICGLQVHVAMMSTVAPATCRKICVGVCRQGIHLRDHRKIEEEQQRKCQEAAHGLIVQRKEMPIAV